ncbi:MAG: alpha/beta hydrolase [Halobacteriovoraceae bacterium]|nr:alpha/beta hydrolase [Halobacteriovoraceae bacterium]
MNLLLLRGLGREYRHWGDFPQELKKIDSKVNVHFIDLPGFGIYTNLDSPLTISSTVKFLRKEYLKIKNGHKGDWHLITISLGGMIGLYWANKYKNDFKSLTVINSSSGNLSPLLHRLRPFGIAKLLEVATKKTNLDRESTVLDLVINSTKGKKEIAKRHARYLDEHPLKIENVLRQLAAAAMFRLPKKMNIPLLILCSLQDKMVNPQCSFELSKHFNAHCISHPNAGHDLPLEDPKWSAQEILSWIKYKSS